jgi:hypothetical protein
VVRHLHSPPSQSWLCDIACLALGRWAFLTIGVNAVDYICKKSVINTLKSTFVATSHFHLKCLHNIHPTVDLPHKSESVQDLVFLQSYDVLELL